VRSPVRVTFERDRRPGNNLPIVLTDRLNRLVDEGVLVRVRYSQRPERFEYRLTKKGRDLGVALLALMQWGDRYLSMKPPRIARRRSDRSPVSVRLVAKDGSPVAPDDLELLPGPGAQPNPAPSNTRSARGRRRRPPQAAAT
jgi:hypothetical protein